MFLITLITSFVAAIPIAGIYRSYNSYDVFLLLSLPFAVVDVVSYVLPGTRSC